MGDDVVELTGDADPLLGQLVPGEVDAGDLEERDPSAQFTPNNVQTADDRSTLTFGVKVRIKDAGNRLYEGTTVSVMPP